MGSLESVMESSKLKQLPVDQERPMFSLSLTVTFTIHMWTSVSLLTLKLPPFDESSLSAIEHEAPLSSVSATAVAQFSYPIQSICSGFSSALSKCIIILNIIDLVIVCGIDNHGNIKLFEEVIPGELHLLRSITHSDSTNHVLEESWTQIRLSPSGSRVSLFLFSISSFSLSTDYQTHSTSFLSPTRVVVSSSPQAIPVPPVGATSRRWSSVRVASCLSTTWTVPEIACRSAARRWARVRYRVWAASLAATCAPAARAIAGCSCWVRVRWRSWRGGSWATLRRRWKAPIRSTAVGLAVDTVQSEPPQGLENVAYLCGDDNEVLMYNASAREEDATLRERHSVNVRSRSRVVGMDIQKNTLYVLGQNGDLDVIVDPCKFICERRKRIICKEDGENEKKRALDDWFALFVEYTLAMKLPSPIPNLQFSNVEQIIWSLYEAICEVCPACTFSPAENGSGPYSVDQCKPVHLE